MEFAFERIRILPNTRAAHRLIEFAARRGGARLKEGLIDALFEAYFLRGEDIGDDAVLSRIAADFALGREEAAAALRAADFMPEATPWRGDVTGVPFYRFNDRWTVSGAQPPEILLPAMRQALEEAAAR